MTITIQHVRDVVAGHKTVREIAAELGASPPWTSYRMKQALPCPACEGFGDREEARLGFLRRARFDEGADLTADEIREMADLERRFKEQLRGDGLDESRPAPRHDDVIPRSAA